jgi:hypothetical protein
MWKRLAERPGGSWLFSAAAMVRVPVQMLDESGIETVHADITCWVPPA